ncbi:YjeJ family protein [Atlantibacter subterraneus]|uniref:YjeJ family protein n=1 Tax=Atlantibacter subterraneus TaxID=255519 RepID=UPI00142F1762
MPAIVKGINSGVICHNKHFVSLALKIRNINDKENLFLFSLPQLQDLLHALESRIESFSQPQDSSQPARNAAPCARA